MSRLIDSEHFEQILIDLIDHGDHKNAYVHHAYKMRNVAINECRKMLWEEPTVDAITVRHGHWIASDPRTTDAFWVCSHCGFPSEAHGAFKLYKYCPQCGTLMDEVTE